MPNRKESQSEAKEIQRPNCSWGRPSNPDPRVLRALAEPTLGHLDRTSWRSWMRRLSSLRYVFSTRRTNSPSRCPVQVRPEWTALVNSVGAGKGHHMLGRRLRRPDGGCGREAGAQVVRSSHRGRAIDPDDVKKAIRKNPDARWLALSTVRLPQECSSLLMRCAVPEAGMRIVVDTVASLGGVDVPTDRLGLDFVYQFASAWAARQACAHHPERRRLLSSKTGRPSARAGILTWG